MSREGLRLGSYCLEQVQQLLDEGKEEEGWPSFEVSTCQEVLLKLCTDG